MIKKVLILFVVSMSLFSCTRSEIPQIIINYGVSSIVDKYTEGNVLQDGDHIYFVLKNNENFDIDLPSFHIDFINKNGNIVASAYGEDLFNNDNIHLSPYTFFRRNDLTPFEGEIYLSDTTLDQVRWDTYKFTFSTEDISLTNGINYPTYSDYCKQEESFAEYSKYTIYYPTRDYFVETMSILRDSNDGFFSEFEIRARITYLGDDYSTQIEPVVLIYEENYDLVGIEECFPYTNMSIELDYKESYDFICEFNDYVNKYNYEKMKIEWIVQGLKVCQY